MRCSFRLFAAGVLAFVAWVLYTRVQRLIRDKGRVVEDPQLACAEAWKTTQLVWVLSYAFSADNALLPHSCRTRHFQRSAYLPARPNSLVFVPTHHVERWATEVLPLITNHTRGLVLVTADAPTGDYAKPFHTPGLVKRVLSHPAVTGWFSPNTLHARVVPLPLGIDYHDGALRGRVQPGLTLAHLRRPWALYTRQASPAAQEASLFDAIRGLPPAASRSTRAWSDFQFEKANPLRGQLWARLKSKDWIDTTPHRLPRVELWARKGRNLFDLSPRGHGIDCYRTWESLALGMVVIVQRVRGPLDQLYEGLPVVLVDDYDEVSNVTLARWAEEHKAKFARGDYPTVELAPGVRVLERLTTAYWVRVMRTRAASP